ncbi:MAG: hypothetical protein ACI4GC_06300 [Acutalibacteraceae bacterium]
MVEKDYNRLYRKAKKIIGDKTPLKKDCGKLCQKACCKGDENTGMLLFPFEETSLNIKEKDGVRLCVCGGTCNRKERPLSCMLFPLFPYINKQGKIKVKADLRGKEICPLTESFDKVKFDRGFIRRVKEVGRLLKDVPECREFLEEISRELDLRELLN